MKEKDFPPPVTKKSSKKELWDELECAREESENLQEEVIQLREKVENLVYQNNCLHHTLAVVKVAVNGPR